jgi:septal ring-binding cell division protein DamX
MKGFAIFLALIAIVGIWVALTSEPTSNSEKDENHENERRM